MQSIKVLLVDDDPSYHVLTSRMLARADQHFDVEWVGTFEEGLSRLNEQSHDIYLLDYNLGEGQSGLELLRAANKNGLLKPVIMMTGHGEHGLDVEALQSGAMDYIDKVELRPAALQRSIRYALERAQISQRLRESEELYRSLVEEAFDGILITDAQGKIQMTNKRVCEMFGLDSTTIVGKKITDLIQPLKGQPALLNVSEGTVSENIVPRDEGDDLEVEVSAKSLAQNRVQFIVRDITGRKTPILERDRYIQQLTILRQVDEEMSQILDLNYVLTMAMDAATRLSGANSGFIGLMDENDELHVKQSIGLYGTLDPDEFLPKMALVSKLVDNLEPRLILDVSTEPDYSPIIETTRARMMLPLLSYEKLIGVIILETNRPERFTEDIFDFIKLISYRVAVAAENANLYKVAQDRYNELQTLYSQVSELEQLKTDMIRIAAHDIRNPVSVILGYVELMQMAEDDLTPKFDRYLKMIEGATRRLEKITDDILSLERWENPNDEDEAPLTDLTATIAEAYDGFEGQAGLKDQAISLATEDKPVMVRGEAAQLREAAANLISNAIKYTPNGGNVRVRLFVEDVNAIFQVQDNGFGVPEDQQDKLFQPFYRARNDKTKDIEGTGLGLYLIKKIIERFDGEILFSSAYGEGSTFGFRLPLQLKPLDSSADASATS